MANKADEGQYRKYILLFNQIVFLKIRSFSAHIQYLVSC